MRSVIVKVIVVVLLAVTAKQVYRIVTTWGTFAHYYRHYPGPCKYVEGLEHGGSEDLHTLSNGQTFIMSGLRNKIMSAKCQDYWRRHKVEGRVYLLDLSDKKKQALKELKIASTSQFNVDTFAPQALSVWEDKKTGRHVVYVVNHPYEEGSKDRIEKFVYEPSKQELVHQAYYSDPSMTGVNAMLATGENSFYFTNANYFTSFMGLMVETLLALPLCDVIYFNGQSYTVVDSGLKGPNGIGMSPDKKYIYVGAVMSQEIFVYKRHKNNTLTRVQTYPVYSWPDNIKVDGRTGDLYVALHPVPYEFFGYLDDVENVRAPSQVLQLHVKDGLIVSSQELFYDDGELLASSSAAYVYDGTLVVGSVFHKLLTCQVNVPLLV